ncbi:MAG: UDP-N-acetylglucosamine--N-acetylmuramyl-(pentapeptide) pyrophosphoryl-undecaprenol N-acetylglucosamine transferase [Candidatus Sungbacteria bacterium]|nr:UDP-N-acetylglucosamine--N-acetylmuramyl-(pentapeptide) pyrophosphoryl-undecaprenol N-acetylglucosamine transferase [Candidatus Sungbacteria bacterium]
MRILFTGGGSGGHLFPIVAVIREIKDLAEEKRMLDMQFFYIGPETEGDDILEKEGVVISHIFAGKIRRYFSLKNVLDAVKIVVGIMQALWRVFVLMPDIVFSKSGYGSFPVLFACRLFRLPVIVHESDVVPGRVNRWAASFAKRIAVSFEKTAAEFPKGKVAVTGNPVRKRLLGGSPGEAREEFGVFSGRPVVLILGGSQGSQTLNNTVLGILKELISRYEVIHQAGTNNYEDVLSQAKVILGGRAEEYHIHPLLDEGRLRDAYLLADVIISRAGAGAIFEIAAWGRPAILVPLKNSAQGHQRENAYEYARTGAALVIEEANLTPRLLLHEIDIMVADKERMKRMGEAAQRFARIDGTKVIAEEILRLGLH